jgi:endonuclease/exonuclease/phosphatase family metal-dependent hydrolase
VLPYNNGNGDRAVDLTISPDGTGLWIGTRDGAIYTLGTAGYSGGANVPGAFSQKASGVTADPDGGGYWISTCDGAVHAKEAPAHGQPAGSAYVQYLLGGPFNYCLGPSAPVVTSPANGAQLQGPATVWLRGYPGVDPDGQSVEHSWEVLREGVTSRSSGLGWSTTVDRAVVLQPGAYTIRLLARNPQDQISASPVVNVYVEYPETIISAEPPDIPRPSFPPGQSFQDVSVMTYNILGKEADLNEFSEIDNIAETVLDRSPNVVFFQEVRQSDGWGQQNDATDLTARLAPGNYRCEAKKRNLTGTTESLMMCIDQDWEATGQLRTESYNIPSEGIDLDSWPPSINYRNVQIGTVMVGTYSTHKLCLINTHLPTPVGSGEGKTDEARATKLKRAFLTEATPWEGYAMTLPGIVSQFGCNSWVLGGDMNMKADNPAYSDFVGQYNVQDSWRVLHPDSARIGRYCRFADYTNPECGFTSSTHDSFYNHVKMRIDYVFGSSHVDTRNAWTPYCKYRVSPEDWGAMGTELGCGTDYIKLSRSSDHLPYMAYLRIPT